MEGSGYDENMESPTASQLQNCRLPRVGYRVSVTAIITIAAACHLTFTLMISRYTGRSRHLPNAHARLPLYTNFVFSQSLRLSTMTTEFVMGWALDHEHILSVFKAFLTMVVETTAKFPPYASLGGSGVICRKRTVQPALILWSFHDDIGGFACFVDLAYTGGI